MTHAKVTKMTCGVQSYIRNDSFLTQRMGSNMIIVRKISNNVPVHVDGGKDVISKGNSKSVLNQKMISVCVLKVS